MNAVSRRFINDSEVLLPHVGTFTGLSDELIPGLSAFETQLLIYDDLRLVILIKTCSLGVDDKTLTNVH